MNVEAYISSGILEAYALGELSEHERAEVEKNLALHPELRKELAHIEEAQEKFLMNGAIQPRPSVKEKLFEQIDAQSSGKVVELQHSSRTFLALLRCLQVLSEVQDRALSSFPPQHVPAQKAHQAHKLLKYHSICMPQRSL